MQSSRYDDLPLSDTYPAEKDREPSSYSSRKLPQAREDERDLRRRGR